MPSPGLFVCLHFIYLWGALHVTACSWRSEDSLRDLIISLRYLGSKDETQVVRLGGSHLYLLSHRLAGPIPALKFLFVWFLRLLPCVTSWADVSRGKLVLNIAFSCLLFPSPQTFTP